MSYNKLVELPFTDWKTLRDLYTTDWRKHMIGYFTLNNFIRWFQKEPNIKHIHVYSLNGDWKDGTFLIVDRYELFINSLNDSNERLIIAVSLLEWLNGYKISTLLIRHRPPIDNVIKSNKLTTEFDHLTKLYYLPHDKGNKLEISVPVGFTLKPLSEENAEQINSLWSNRHHGSLIFIKRVIAGNTNVGLFRNEDSLLVAWCLRFQAGVLGALQVDENHTRMGYGTLVLKAITKQLALMNEDTCACVTPYNIASIKMFENTGFESVDQCYWVQTYPVIDFLFED